ncbi:hypothetical protein [Flavobacterium sp.]|uniref:hypothetical protein n=1 Tax=Flavobacterium sp. TaxID=239 RepID=UPI0039E3EF07
MNRLLQLFAILATTLCWAQVPQGISYQAIALNGSGNPVVNSNVGVRLSILDNSASGTVLYTETQTKTTNPQGLFNLVIGQGTATFGVFAGINWKTNFKFLKVEMDVAGGTNYALVGTSQLLTVPYAMAAESLVLSPGEGITLISPNGTPYTLSVNDGGTLSLPTSGSTSNLPATLYAYGTFNGYNPSTALLMGTDHFFFTYRIGYKYFTSGTEIKFLSQNNAASPVYGINGMNDLVVNGSAYTIPSNGFYLISTGYSGGPNPIYHFDTPASISPSLYFEGMPISPTYNVGTNIFTYIVNGVSTATETNFQFSIPTASTSGSGANVGDNLADGSIEFQGASINFPNVTATPKNYRVELTINFNGSGTYTITQI